MTPLAIIAGLLRALTAALEAFPIMLAWKLNGEIEQITHDIIDHEERATPDSKRRADELRIKLAYRRRLHDALCASIPPPESGNGGSNIARAIPVPD